MIPLLAFYSANLIVYWAGWETNKKLFITILIGYVLLVVSHLIGAARRTSRRWSSRSGLRGWCRGSSASP